MGLEKGLGGGHVACGGVCKASLPFTSCELITTISLIPSPGGLGEEGPLQGALGEHRDLEIVVPPGGDQGSLHTGISTPEESQCLTIPAEPG